MIIDLQRFVEGERPYWEELAAFLDRLERSPTGRLELADVRRLHMLYERVSADLSKLTTSSGERETRAYLETLVARAYGEIHETRAKPHRLRPLHWFFVTFPCTFRRHIRAFGLSSGITLGGCALGVLLILLDPGAKEVIMPFPHLLSDPSERVAKEEEALTDRLQGSKSQFAATLMVNNTRVSILTMAMGATWGVGTVLLLFFNGVMVGAVGADYLAAGQARFLAGWLLPHGSIEIPAILLAGQAGLVLAGAMIGWGRRMPLGERLREVAFDVVTIVFGVALMLVWAGIVEAFLSQYHQPTLPYSLKIAFGAAELGLLVVFLARSGKRGAGVPGVSFGAGLVRRYVARHHVGRARVGGVRGKAGRP